MEQVTSWFHPLVSRVRHHGCVQYRDDMSPDERYTIKPSGLPGGLIKYDLVERASGAKRELCRVGGLVTGTRWSADSKRFAMEMGVSDPDGKGAYVTHCRVFSVDGGSKEISWPSLNAVNSTLTKSVVFNERGVHVIRDVDGDVALNDSVQTIVPHSERPEYTVVWSTCDGLIAFQSSDGSQTPSLVVCSTQTGEVVHRLDLDTTEDLHQRIICFSPGTRFIAEFSPDSNILLVWQLSPCRLVVNHAYADQDVSYIRWDNETLLTICGPAETESCSKEPPHKFYQRTRPIVEKIDLSGAI